MPAAPPPPSWARRRPGPAATRDSPPCPCPCAERPGSAARGSAPLPSSAQRSSHSGALPLPGTAAEGWSAQRATHRGGEGGGTRLPRPSRASPRRDAPPSRRAPAGAAPRRAGGWRALARSLSPAPGWRRRHPPCALAGWLLLLLLLLGRPRLASPRLSSPPRRVMSAGGGGRAGLRSRSSGWAGVGAALASGQPEPGRRVRAGPHVTPGGGAARASSGRGASGGEAGCFAPGPRCRARGGAQAPASEPGGKAGSRQCSDSPLRTAGRARGGGVPLPRWGAPPRGLGERPLPRVAGGGLTRTPPRRLVRQGAAKSQPKGQRPSPFRPSPAGGPRGARSAPAPPRPTRPEAPPPAETAFRLAAPEGEMPEPPERGGVGGHLHPSIRPATVRVQKTGRVSQAARGGRGAATVMQSGGCGGLAGNNGPSWAAAQPDPMRGPGSLPPAPSEHQESP